MPKRGSCFTSSSYKIGDRVTIIQKKRLCLCGCGLQDNFRRRLEISKATPSGIRATLSMVMLLPRCDIRVSFIPALDLNSRCLFVFMMCRSLTRC